MLETFSAANTAGKRNLGVLVVMKSHKFCSMLLQSLSALVLFTVAGCGGSGATNVVTVAVSPSSTAVIVSQSVNLIATVSGSTDLNVTWMCQYTTTTVSSSGTSTTSSKSDCNSDILL